MTTQESEEGEIWMAAARMKLHRLCGPVDGERRLHDGLVALGLSELRSAADLYRLAAWFVRQGGFLEALGYALQFQATLLGGKPPSD